MTSTTPPAGAPGTPPSQPTERRFEPLERAERIWLRIGVVMLIAFMVLTGFDVFLNTSHNSHGSHMIDPGKVSTTPPFDHPGTSKNADGTWDAVVVAYAFGFLPREDLVVPEDVDVHFQVASVDVVHGFQIPGKTNVNLMVLPGHVSEMTQHFSTPGRYLILCNEYCGSGHHFMTTHIRVLRKGEDPLHPPKLDDGTAATTSVQAAAGGSDDMVGMDMSAGAHHGSNA